MNKVYKVIWSKTRHCYVVTSELAKRQGKSCGARTLRRSAVTLGVTVALLGGWGYGGAVAYADTVNVNSGQTVSISDDQEGNIYNLNGSSISLTVSASGKVYGINGNYDGAVNGNSVDVSGSVVAGVFGKQRGITANLQATWTF